MNDKIKNKRGWFLVNQTLGNEKELMDVIKFFYSLDKDNQISRFKSVYDCNCDIYIKYDFDTYKLFIIVTLDTFTSVLYPDFINPTEKKNLYNKLYQLHLYHAISEVEDKEQLKAINFKLENSIEISPSDKDFLFESYRSINQCQMTSKISTGDFLRELQDKFNNKKL